MTSPKVVRAPARGMVPCLFLVPGMGVSPSRSVLTFVNTEEAAIVALFQQIALQAVRIGALMVNFPALPGQVLEAEVIGLPNAIGDAQPLATGQLPSIQQAKQDVYLARADLTPPENALQQAIAG